MSGRGKGGKGLGAYRRHIEEHQSVPLFLSILPKKYHNTFKDKKIHQSNVEYWLHKIFEGVPWEVRSVKEELGQYLSVSPEKIRFMRVANMTPSYSSLKNIHDTKRVTKIRKKRVLSDIVDLEQLPHLKYRVGGPEYMKAMQGFLVSTKALTQKKSK